MITIDHKSIRIPVLATGEGWLMVDKPAGLTVHNTPGQDVCSLVSGFFKKNPAVSDLIKMDPTFRVNPVHRLDKETSGILLLAVTPEMFRFFSNQFESRQVRKRYVAILHGMLENPKEGDPWGIWHWALAKTAGGRQRPEGAGPRQPATTRYRILDRSARYSLVEIEPLTGRKHQIRRHAKLSGHSVVGDARYGSKRAAAVLKKTFDFDRLALHAQGLTLQLTGRTKPETITTPDVPESLRNLFENDRET
jgi:RluA family pseudouridine synthase